MLDIEQAVIRGVLSLGVLVETSGDPDSAQEAVEQAMATVGMSVRIRMETSRHPIADPRLPTHSVIVLGQPLPAKAISVLARAFGEANVNIETIRRVADYPVTGVEFGVHATDSAQLRTLAASVAASAAVDIAVDRMGLQRRAKRLIIFDVDSTLITGEVIEMLAQRTGHLVEVTEVTAAAMRGELDFEQSLRRRVALLKGLSADIFDEVAQGLTLTPGARTTIRTLKELGFQCGIVSGGFTQITDKLAQELGLDYAVANTLEVDNGVLTGGLVGPIIDRAAKARALEDFAARAGVSIKQTVAVGDGANDIDMLTTAGLGIAFNAKPTVAQHADTALNLPFLDTVLFVLGITRREIETVDTLDPITTRYIRS